MQIARRSPMKFNVRSEGPQQGRLGPNVPDSGSLEKAADDLWFHPDDFTLTRVCGNRGGGGNREEGIGGLVFNPDDHPGGLMTRRVSNVRKSLLNVYRLALRGLGNTSSKVNPRVGAALAIISVLLGVILYLAFWDSYRVETRLLFFQGDNLAKDSSTSLLAGEVEMLKNPELMNLFAGNLYEQIAAMPPASRDEGTFTAEIPTPAHLHKALVRDFASSAELTRWLQKTLSVKSETSNGVAMVTLSLPGDNPELLKAVLDAYVDRYAKHRLMLVAQAGNQARQGSTDPVMTHGPHLPAQVSEQLQRIELQQHGCELALKLIDQGRGVFSGFVPDANFAGTSSVGQFQEKIVQLEIKKKALEVQFTPNSREIRAVDLEIQGVKEVMRECLVGHLEFLRTGKQQILAQHHQAEPRKIPTSGRDQTGEKGSESEGLAKPNTWFLIRDGLYMLRDRPQVSNEPLLVRAGHFKGTALAYLFPPDGGKVVSKSVRTKNPTSRVAEASPGNAAAVTGTGKISSGSRPEQEGADGLSNLLSGRRSGSRVHKSPTDTEVRYWESIPASNFGRKSLW